MLIPFESSELPLRGYIIAIMDSSLSLNRQSVLAPTVGITVCFANWRRYSAPLLQPGDQVPQPQARGCDTGGTYYNVSLETAALPFPTPSNLAGQSPPSKANFYKEIDRMRDICGTYPSSPAAAPMTLLTYSTTPIIRMNPTEVRVRDPGWYEKLYGVHRQIPLVPRPHRGRLHRQLRFA